MGKHRVIPQGFMTVGQIAKKMNTTVRTLQYYDKEGILSPSAVSEGGRRLYTDKDIVKLHQIQSMKYFGFSLDDIKAQLLSLDTPQKVSDTLQNQGAAIKKEIERLTEILQNIEILREEVLQIDTIDWKKYSAIILNLHLGNNYYGIVKQMDNDTLDMFAERFTPEQAKILIDRMNEIFDIAIKFQKDGILPESDEAQNLVKEFWDIIIQTTGGDMGLIQKFADGIDYTTEDGKKYFNANIFLEPALGIYLANM